jgi:hypothetical protein
MLLLPSQGIDCEQKILRNNTKKRSGTLFLMSLGLQWETHSTHGHTLHHLLNPDHLSSIVQYHVPGTRPIKLSINRQPENVCTCSTRTSIAFHLHGNQHSRFLSFHAPISWITQRCTLRRNENELGPTAGLQIKRALLGS